MSGAPAVGNLPDAAGRPNPPGPFFAAWAAGKQEGGVVCIWWLDCVVCCAGGGVCLVLGCVYCVRLWAPLVAAVWWRCIFLPVCLSLLTPCAALHFAPFFLLRISAPCAAGRLPLKSPGASWRRPRGYVVVMQCCVHCALSTVHCPLFSVLCLLVPPLCPLERFLRPSWPLLSTPIRPPFNLNALCNSNYTLHNIYVYIHIYVYTYLNIYTCRYVYIYIYTYMHAPSLLPLSPGAAIKRLIAAKAIENSSTSSSSTSSSSSSSCGSGSGSNGSGKSRRESGAPFYVLTLLGLNLARLPVSVAVGKVTT